MEDGRERCRHCSSHSTFLHGNECPQVHRNNIFPSGLRAVLLVEWHVGSFVGSLVLPLAYGFTDVSSAVIHVGPLEGSLAASLLGLVDGFPDDSCAVVHVGWGIRPLITSPCRRLS